MYPIITQFREQFPIVNFIKSFIEIYETCEYMTTSFYVILNCTFKNVSTYSGRQSRFKTKLKNHIQMHDAETFL